MTASKIFWPPASLPFANDDGSPVADWYLALLSLYNRTGGAAGVSSNDVQTQVSDALAVAVIARINSLAAQGGASSAQSTADTAQSTAEQALVAATAIAAEALIRESFVVPISFFWSGLATYPVYVPIVQALTLPANFTGFSLYCGTPAATATAFILNYIRGGGVYPIGSITLPIGGNTSAAISGSVAVSLQAGDVLTMGPGVPDVMLADVGITFALSLT